jgi:hypothetical protein
VQNGPAGNFIMDFGDPAVKVKEKIFGAGGLLKMGQNDPFCCGIWVNIERFFPDGGRSP